jgi:hypothetical protein
MTSSSHSDGKQDGIGTEPGTSTRRQKNKKTTYQTKTKTMTKDWTAHELGIDDEKMDGLWLKAVEAPTNVV